jgi:hypothetical protein
MEADLEKIKVTAITITEDNNYFNKKNVTCYTWMQGPPVNNVTVNRRYLMVTEENAFLLGSVPCYG